MIRIQSPLPEFPPAVIEARTITVVDSVYRYIPGHTLDATPEDAAWIVANVPGWRLIGPVEEPSPVEPSL